MGLKPHVNPLRWMTRHLLELDQWDRKITLKRYDHLRIEGDCDTNIHYIVKGCLRAYQMATSGKEQNTRFGYSGEVIISLPDFITNQASDLNLQAIRETELLSMKRITYEKIIQADTKATLAWGLIKDQMVLQHLDREKDLLTETAQERFERVQQRSPRLFQEVPAKYIANYLRMTPETLSRLLKS